MKCDLEGLLVNVAAELKKHADAADIDDETDMSAYYNFAILEVARHVKETREGQHTLEEFADHYCFKERVSADG